MPEIMIVNPRGKPRKTKKKKQKRSSVKRGGASMATKRKTARKKPSPRKAGSRKSVRVTVRNPRKKKSRSRRRSNPRGMGVSIPGVGKVDIVPMLGGTGIAIGSRLLPTYLQKYVGLPTAGIPGYLVQAGAGIGLAYVVRTFLKQPKVAEYGVLFTLSNVITRLADDLIFKGESLGSLLGQGYPPSIWEAEPFLETERLLGGSGLGLLPGQSPSVFEDMPGVSGQFEPGPVVDRFRARF